jgi:glycine/sarcosine N-methyltransferase
MSDSVVQFYDQLAEDYHLIFADWKASIQRQAVSLDGLIRRLSPGAPGTLLDCTCGIGTQAIGLALKGYHVHGTDLSPEAIARAKREAALIEADLTFEVADLRTLDQQVSGTFDVVLSCDNAIAHFLETDNLKLAVHNMAHKVSAGGLLLISIRDYDRIIQEKPRSTPPTVLDNTNGRQLSFQVWDWDANGWQYTVSHFSVKQDGEQWTTACRVTTLRAWQREEITAILSDIGLTGVQWHMPTDSGFYQPIVTGRKTV